MLGLKTSLAVSLRCLLLRLGALSLRWPYFPHLSLATLPGPTAHRLSASLSQALLTNFFFFVSEKISYSSTGISEQYLFKQGILKVVMIYSIIPVESPKTPVSL